MTEDKKQSKKAIQVIARTVQKIHTHFFENSEVQFNEILKKINTVIDKCVTDDDKKNGMLSYQERINIIQTRFMNLELDMLILKNELLDYAFDEVKQNGTE